MKKIDSYKKINVNKLNIKTDCNQNSSEIYNLDIPIKTIEKWKKKIDIYSKFLKSDIVFISSDRKYKFAKNEHSVEICIKDIEKKIQFDNFEIKWPNKNVFASIYVINKKKISNDMIDIIHEYIDLIESDLQIIVLRKKYNDLLKREKNISKIAKIEEHNKKILSKSFVEKDDILSIFQIDLNLGSIIDHMSKYESLDWKNKSIDELVDFNFVNISEKDKAKYLFFYSLDFMRDSAKKEKRISIEYNQKFRYKNVLVKATLEFVNYPDDDENVAFLFIQDITVQNELNKLLDVVIWNQNEYVYRADLNTERINMYASKNNFLGLKEGFSILEFSEYDKKINMFFKSVRYDNSNIFSAFDIFEKINRGETLSVNMEYKDLKENDFIKRVTFYRPDRNENSAFVIVQDVTDLVVNERVMRRKLEENLSKIKKSKQLADDANAIKDLFFSNISHDIKTPLNAIIGFTNLGIKETTEDKARDYFRKIKSNSEYLNLMITDMLELQKIASDNLLLEKNIFRLIDLRRVIINIITPKITERKIRFISDFEEFEMFPYVKSDEKRIGQAMINILTNAIKYSEIGGEVIWKSETLGYTSDKVIKKYSIIDNGIGMTSDFQKNMYKPFLGNNTKFGNKNKGLGLAISKNIIESMNGTISCESEPEKGTKFTLIVPYTVASESEINEYLTKLVTCDSYSKLHNKKILVCDDVKVNAVILRKILKSEGMIIDIANDGKEALEKVKKNDYDAILMDIRMPIMDGLEATREIRKFNKLVPIIAVSANSYDSDIEDSIKAGMNEHISKPIRRNHLLTCLEKFINQEVK